MTPPAPLQTDRLWLKPPVPEDAPAIAAALADEEVVLWLTQAPNPYTLADAQDFLAKVVRKSEVWMIHDASGLVGCVGCEGEFGYWLARPAWGQGYVTEAGAAVLAHHFGVLDGGDVISGHYPGNARSARVLDKLGFEGGPDRTVYSKSRQCEVTIIGRALSRARYFSLQSLE
jgi:RimJ/RimL family protein N-acetyltransferase